MLLSSPFPNDERWRFRLYLLVQLGEAADREFEEALLAITRHLGKSVAMKRPKDMNNCRREIEIEGERERQKAMRIIVKRERERENEGEREREKREEGRERKSAPRPACRGRRRRRT